MATQPLSIGIVGAGMVGLTAAITLRKAGHDVELFERSLFNDEVGAAITIHPSAQRALNEYGVETATADGVTAIHTSFMYNSQTGDLIVKNLLQDKESLQSRSTLSFHRPTLHSHLKDHATGPHPDETKPAKLHLGREVVEIDFENGTLHFADGSTVQKDLVVIADGVNTRFLPQIAQVSSPPELESEMDAYRFLIPTEKVLANDQTKSLASNLESGVIFATVREERVSFVAYPCQSGRIINCGLVYPKSDTSSTKSGWNNAATKEQVLDKMKSFHPIFQAFAGLIDTVSQWSLVRRSPIKNWIRGKAVMIGDAAHAMTPMPHGMGLNTGIEDAVALGMIFSSPTTGGPSPRGSGASHAPSGQNIPLLLDKFQPHRIPRATTVQLMSNMIDHPQTELEDQIRYYLKEQMGEGGVEDWIKGLPENTRQKTPELTKWLYGYDVVGETGRFLEKEKRLVA